MNLSIAAQQSNRARVTRLRDRVSLAFVLATALSGIAIAPACSNKPPAVPALISSGDATAGQPAVNAAGAQVGISDAPSTAVGEPADDRPKMNASAKTAYQKGMAFWQNSDLAAAKQAFLEATQADRQAYQAFYSLGVMQELLGDGAALESYRTAFTIVPSYEPAIVAYGLNLGRKGQLSEADDFLSEKKDRMPKSAAVLAALAEVKSLKRDTGTAQQYAQEALKLNPKYEPAMIVLARDHHRNRRLDLALYALKAVLDGENENNPARNKNNAEGHLLRAIIYKEQQRRALAMDEFKRSVELRPDFVDARVQLATYLLESGNPDEALPQLDAALKYQSENVKARLNRADAYRLLGKVPEAKAEFEWVAKKDGTMPQTYYGLGLLYLNSQTVPGMDEKARLAAAISSLEKYQQLRSKTASDDSDQLLQRAKAKQDAINANEQAAAQASAQAAAAAQSASAASASPSASAAPAASASAAP